MVNLKDPRLHITFLKKRFHLYQIPVTSQIPREILVSPTDFTSVTTTLDEISIVNTKYGEFEGLDLDIKHE
ncbi:hypothetical protein LTS18_002415, partial [Coniosporium uncinatum]